MKPKEKEFCRLMSIGGDPERAARDAGYKHPAQCWPRLLCREDIAAQIRSNTKALCAVFRDTAVCGLYRVALGNPSDALKLLYRENPSDEELDALELSSVAEIKRTKDKSMEIKFFDRVKAADKLNELLNSTEKLNSSGGLIEAMMLSAQALGRSPLTAGDTDED